MRLTGKMMFGALSVMALIAGAGTATAQAAGPQLLTVPPGYFAVLAPDGSATLVPAAQFTLGVPEMPDPFAMMRQMDAMMAAAQQQALAVAPSGPGLLQAALPQMPAVSGPVSGVSVITVSDGRTSCTERVVYPATGGAAQISAAGNGCGGANLPGTVETAAPPPAVYAPAPPPLVVADRD